MEASGISLASPSVSAVVALSVGAHMMFLAK
jgi:hypothetical protein